MLFLCLLSCYSLISTFYACFYFMSTLIPLICFTHVRLFVILCLLFFFFSRLWENVCCTLWFEFSDHLRCVWFTSLDILLDWKLGQYSHSLPCPCVLLFVFFRYAKFLQQMFSQDLLFPSLISLSLLYLLPLNSSSSFSSYLLFFFLIGSVTDGQFILY